MATRTIATRLTLEGEKEYRKQLSDLKKDMGLLGDEVKYVDERYRDNAESADKLREQSRLLREMQEKQAEKVKVLENAVKDCTEAYGDQDSRVKDYKRQLVQAQTQLEKITHKLNDNEQALDDASKSADDYKDSIGNLEDKANNFSIDGFISKLGSLKGALIGGVAVGAVKELGSAIIGTVDETAEYRKIMGTLEVSSKNAGYTADETAESYNRLYGALGDNQQAATTVANLQAIGLEQEDLMKLVDATTGAWATYGDSIPIDGLAESINETIQTGKVTGTFADVLNWAGDILEDDFNASLENCNSQMDRAQFLLDTLAKQGLPDAGQAWYDANEDIVDYNESQRKFEEAMGKMGEVLEPVATALKEVLAGGLNRAADAVQWLIDKTTTAISKLKDLKSAWDERVDEINSSVEEHTGRNRSQNSMHGSRGVRGSHAGGLYRVPYDGYVAELHSGERVLTAREADTYNALERYGRMSGGVTAQEMRTAVAQAVNAVIATNRETKITINNTMRVNGKEFYRETIEDLRAVDRSTPEVGEKA